MRRDEFRLVVIFARRCCTRVLITAACGRFVLHDFFGRLVPLKTGNTQPSVTTQDCVAQAPGIQCRCATGIAHQAMRLYLVPLLCHLCPMQRPTKDTHGRPYSQLVRAALLSVSILHFGVRCDESPSTYNKLKLCGTL